MTTARRSYTSPTQRRPCPTISSKMSENKIGGIPVVNAEKKLVGIITNRDLRFEKKLDRKVAEVMTAKNLITAKEGVDLLMAEDILQQHKIEKLPVVDKDNHLIGLITFRDIIKL